MTEQPLYLYVATYPDRAHALADWDRLEAADKANEVVLHDGAVVDRDAEGKVTVDARHHHRVGKGALIGAAVALVTPVGLAAGLIGGALAGKISEKMAGAISKDDARFLGQALEQQGAVVLALVDAEQTGAVRACLSNATEHVESGITATKAQFDKLVADADLGGGTVN